MLWGAQLDDLSNAPAGNTWLSTQGGLPCVRLIETAHFLAGRRQVGSRK